MNIQLGSKREPAYDFRSMLENSAAAYGEKEYLVYKRGGGLESLSYAGFEERVRALSEAFFDLGIAGGSVAVVGETSPEWIITYLATIITGGVIVPLDKELSVDAIAGFVKKVGCSCVVYSKKCAVFFENKAEYPTVDYFVQFDPEKEPSKVDQKPEKGEVDFVEMLNFGRRRIDEGSEKYESAAVDMEKVCAILFTSGTTGSSKGVMLCQKNIIHAINGSYRRTGFESDDVVVSVLPIHHTYEMTCGILTPLYIGATVCINDSLKYIVRNFQLFKPTGLVLVPLFVTTVYKKIWETARKGGKEKLLRGSMAVSGALRKVKIDPRKLLFKEVQKVFGGRLERIICGGAPMPADLVADFEAFGIKLCQGYGITECAPLISVCPEKNNKAGSVGPAIPGVKVKIDVEEEEDGKLIGEILVNGPNVMKGYFMDDEATADVLNGSWFRTGDYGYLDEDGYIFITGRKKNVIVLNNGKNVFPEEIEEYLSKIELVKECVVIGRTSEDGTVVVTALIFPDMPRAVEMGMEDDINVVGAAIKEEIAKLNRTLPSFKQIRGIEMRRTEFEKNTSKKIIRYTIK
ncbi:MAG: AMP-binding protein [Clostridia bacterium]|nr:AMP-binding protein [Clostridia bacterium]